MATYFLNQSILEGVRNKLNYNPMYYLSVFTVGHSCSNIWALTFVWSDVRVLKFTAGKFLEFEYKESYGVDAGSAQLMSYSKKNKDYGCVNINAVQKCYNGPVPISSQKKRDLLSLLEYIDPSVHDFYHNLRTNSNLRDIDPDLSEIE